MKNDLITFSVLSALFFFMPFQANAAITYATWNPSDKSDHITLSNGNLTATGDGNAGVGWFGVRATINKTSGKWSYENTITDVSAIAWFAGMTTLGKFIEAPATPQIGTWVYYFGDGNVYCNGSNVGSEVSMVIGDVLTVAYDATNATIDFYKNGSTHIAQCTGVTNGVYPLSWLQGSSANTVNFGASPFAYAVPSGFNAGLYIDDGLPPPPPPPPPTTGTVNRLAKFITTTTLGDSLFSDDGSNATLTSGNLLMQIGSMIDTIVAGTLNFGTTNATSITIGRSGVTTTFPGPLAVNGLATFGNNVTVPGTVSLGKVTTADNCSSPATPAVCGAASAGSVAMPTTGTLVVNTSAVTANSQILITENSALGTRLGITCNTTTGRVYSISAMTSGVSFAIKSSVNPKKDKACLSYWIIN